MFKGWGILVDFLDFRFLFCIFIWCNTKCEERVHMIQILETESKVLLITTIFKVLNYISQTFDKMLK